MPVSAATSLRVRGGEPTIVDGPFPETKELLLGLYVLDCANLDEAIEYAKQIPHAQTGGIEIRPIAYFEGTKRDQLIWTRSG